MSKGLFATTLALHACPDVAVDKTNELLLRYAIVPSWHSQTLLERCSRAEVTLKLAQAKALDLVSELNALGIIHFELTQTFGDHGLLYMSLPGLGIYRGEINSAGSLVLSEDQINQLLVSSAGNHREFMRLLRIALGQSWDDILEPMRATKYGDNVLLLNRAG
jgi:hypothetical protein